MALTPEAAKGLAAAGKKMRAEVEAAYKAKELAINEEKIRRSNGLDESLIKDRTVKRLIGDLKEKLEATRTGTVGPAAKITSLNARDRRWLEYHFKKNPHFTEEDKAAAIAKRLELKKEKYGKTVTNVVHGLTKSEEEKIFKLQKSLISKYKRENPSATQEMVRAYNLSLVGELRSKARASREKIVNDFQAPGRLSITNDEFKQVEKRHLDKIEEAVKATTEIKNRNVSPTAPPTFDELFAKNATNLPLEEKLSVVRAPVRKPSRKNAGKWNN